MKLNYTKTGLLGFGFFGVSVIWSIYNAFVPVFLSDKFHLSPVYIAFFMTLDNIAALLIQPPVGVWSDKLRTPIGRRMPFILVGAPLAALAFGFLPLAPILPLFVICSSTLLISMALWRTPVVALMADVTPSPLRSQANGIISLMAGVGAIFAYIGGAMLYERNPAFPFWLGSLLVLAAALMVFLAIKEPKISDSVALDETQPGFVESVMEVFKDRDKSALCLLFSLFFLMVGYTAVEGFFTLYATHHLGISEGYGARLLGQLSLAFVIFAVPSGHLAAKWGRRAIIKSGLCLMATLLLVLYFLPVSTLTKPLFSLPILGIVPVAGLILMAIGLSWALIIIHPLPMLADMTNADRIGTYTGVYYLFTSLAAIVGPNINGWIVELSGRNYNAVMLFAPITLFIAWILMGGVKTGEAQRESEANQKMKRGQSSMELS